MNVDEERTCDSTIYAGVWRLLFSANKYHCVIGFRVPNARWRSAIQGAVACLDRLASHHTNMRAWDARDEHSSANKRKFHQQTITSTVNLFSDHACVRTRHNQEFCPGLSVWTCRTQGSEDFLLVMDAEQTLQGPCTFHGLQVGVEVGRGGSHVTRHVDLGTGDRAYIAIHLWKESARWFRTMCVRLMLILIDNRVPKELIYILLSKVLPHSGRDHGRLLALKLRHALLNCMFRHESHNPHLPRLSPAT